MNKRSWLVVANVVGFFVGFPMVVAVLAFLVMSLGWFCTLAIPVVGILFVGFCGMAHDWYTTQRRLHAMSRTPRGRWSWLRY